METQNNITSHLQAIVVAQQKLILIQTLDEVFAWSIFTHANKDTFFNQIITYLKEVILVKQLPTDACNKAQELLEQFQIEFFKSNQLNQTNLKTNKN
ncbi:MAG: hypothetical protein ACOYMA_08535 [Bacteroidia bacterium]